MVMARVGQESTASSIISSAASVASKAYSVPGGKIYFAMDTRLSV
jgi:hypothetical protein